MPRVVQWSLQHKPLLTSSFALTLCHTHTHTHSVSKPEWYQHQHSITQRVIQSRLCVSYSLKQGWYKYSLTHTRITLVSLYWVTAAKALSHSVILNKYLWQLLIDALQSCSVYSVIYVISAKKKWSNCDLLNKPDFKGRPELVVTFTQDRFIF